MVKSESIFGQRGFSDDSFFLGYMSRKSGLPFYTEEEWLLLPYSKKVNTELAGIITASTGYDRGEIISGVEIPRIEAAPVDSWCASNNVKHQYNFLDKTAGENISKYCLAIMAQTCSPGNTKEWGASENLVLVDSDAKNNGTYAICCGAYAPDSYAYTWSTGDNWNSSQILCFNFGNDRRPEVVKTLYYSGENGTFEETYTPTTDEEIILAMLHGGSDSFTFQTDLLDLISTVTASGYRSNRVYHGKIPANETLHMSAYFQAGYGSLGQMIVALVRVN